MDSHEPMDSEEFIRYLSSYQITNEPDRAHVNDIRSKLVFLKNMPAPVYRGLYECLNSDPDSKELQTLLSNPSLPKDLIDKCIAKYEGTRHVTQLDFIPIKNLAANPSLDAAEIAKLAKFATSILPTSMDGNYDLDLVTLLHLVPNPHCSVETLKNIEKYLVEAYINPSFSLLPPEVDFDYATLAGTLGKLKNPLPAKSEISENWMRVMGELLRKNYPANIQDIRRGLYLVYKAQSQYHSQVNTNKIHAQIMLKIIDNILFAAGMHDAAAALIDGHFISSHLPVYSGFMCSKTYTEISRVIPLKTIEHMQELETGAVRPGGKGDGPTELTPLSPNFHLFYDLPGLISLSVNPKVSKQIRDKSLLIQMKMVNIAKWEIDADVLTKQPDRMGLYTSIPINLKQFMCSSPLIAPIHLSELILSFDPKAPARTQNVLLLSGMMNNEKFDPEWVSQLNAKQFTRLASCVHGEFQMFLDRLNKVPLELILRLQAQTFSDLGRQMERVTDPDEFDRAYREHPEWRDEVAKAKHCPDYIRVMHSTLS